jgi:hypothetical protein
MKFGVLFYFIGRQKGWIGFLINSLFKVKSLQKKQRFLAHGNERSPK